MTTYALTGPQRCVIDAAADPRHSKGALMRDLLNCGQHPAFENSRTWRHLAQQRPGDISGR
jgi:hypothetical protein